MLLLEATLAELYENTVKHFPETTNRQWEASSYRPQKMQLVKIDDDTLLFKFKTGKYNQRMQFDDVKFSESLEEGYIKFTNASGDTIYFKPINKNKSDVKVRCSCLDFYYRFAFFNKKENALYGKPPEKYTKKTSRPPVNPDKVPGLCKHLIADMMHLDEKDMLQ